MALINNSNVYDYYLSTYAKQAGGSRYDTHKKSELRGVYNRMVKTNKDAPLYKMNIDDDALNFVIDLKETARNMQNVVSSLTSEGDDIESVFYKKIAVSTNEDAVDVEYVGDDKNPDTPVFEVGVKAVATPQVNTGNFLPANGRDFEAGSYSFDLDTTSNSYEFQFNVNYDDSNYTVQRKIERLINTSNVGLKAEVITNERAQSALQITSKQTGLADSEEYLFSISSGTAWKEIKLLGIDQISSPAESSVFTLNGSEHSSLANTFTINQEFEITIKDVTPDGEPAQIGFKANTEAIADSVDNLLTSFNGFLKVGQKYSSGKGNNQLLNEINSISKSYASELAKVGILINDDMSLALDKEAMAGVVTGEAAKAAFKTLNKFKDALSREADKTAVNPMNYVDKVAVEYKNPGKNFAAPYASSTYSGLLIDQSL
ncbi:MAG: flagellar capping protein [Lachnospiraceae bacterium]|nr:flagellar capping protein [Lachnospiraceae bacterium]